MGSQVSICAICGANYRSDVLFCPRDGAPLGAAWPRGSDPYLGILLPGQILIERLIGVGSMGRVYRGYQTGTDRPVAVKILHRELSTNRTLVTRFHREAQIASNLDHPHVVKVLLAGELPPGPPGAGALYMVMELLDGMSLRSALAAAGGAVGLPRALRIILQLCDGVAEAHAQGIVHRDLKPENIMLLRRGEEADWVKVLDFGIARLPGGNTPAVTQAGMVFGTARYISPEGAAGNPVGPAADVYAIATILYQALSGQTPFEGDSAVTLLARQMSEPPAPIRSIERAAYLPEPVASVIMKNLAKRPDDRSPDAMSLGRAIIEATRLCGLAAQDLLPRSALFAGPPRPASFAAIEPTQPLNLARSLTPTISPATEGLAEPDPPREARSGSRGALAILLGCLVGGAGLAALGAYQWRDRPRDDLPGLPAPKDPVRPSAEASVAPAERREAGGPH